MADPTNTGPMPGFINKGLGMLFGPKPKQPTGGMAPPPGSVTLAAPAPTPEMLGTGLAAKAATELRDRQAVIDETLRRAGAQ